ncbi:hypothetical protein HDU92_005099 [Lobulomyces angularis]|nr:hypothetical protein HDU92_005099 [Lobulomyces angularis]
METKRVVVVGGAYSGVAVITQLLKHPLSGNFHITLIEPSDSFFLSHGAPRAVVDANFLKHCFIPYTNLFLKHENNKIIKQKVVKVLKNLVVLDNGNKVEFDYLIICTGSSYASPFKYNINKSTDEFIEEIKLINSKIQESKEILIIGGGIVGCEVAGEIATDYPNIKVKIITSGKKLLSNTNQSSNLVSKLTTQLHKLNVEIVYNKKIQFLENLKEYSFKTTVKSGSEEFTGDCVFKTIGFGGFNSNLILSLTEEIEGLKEIDFLDEFKRIKVLKTGQLEISKNFPEYKNIFSCGDVSNLDFQTKAYLAGMEGELVAKNVVLLEELKESIE